ARQNRACTVGRDAEPTELARKPSSNHLFLIRFSLPLVAHRAPAAAARVEVPKPSQVTSQPSFLSAASISALPCTFNDGWARIRTSIPSQTTSRKTSHSPFEVSSSFLISSQLSD